MSTFKGDEENFIVSRAAPEQNTARDLHSLAQLISAEQRRRFVRKLCAREAQRFDSLCAQLEAAPAWNLARRLLHQHFKAHGINPYCEAARQLSSLIYKRYFPYDAYV